jgi:hypothetical protein
MLNRSRVWQWIKRRGQTQAAGAVTSSAIPQVGLDSIRRLVTIRNRIFRSGSQPPIRLLEKTPENCLRLPFLEALFPDASVIYLVRDGRANVSSLMEGWRQPHLFPGYEVPVKVQFPGVNRARWAFTLIPGWRDLLSRPLEEVCAWQWIRCNEAVLKYLRVGRLPALQIHYEDLTQNPGIGLLKIAEFLEIDYERELSRFTEQLPQVNVVSEPGEEKWRLKNPAAILRVEPLLEPLMQEFGYGDQTSTN